MNLLKNIGKRFPQKLQHVPIEKFVESEGIIDATGYGRALSRRQTGLGALAVGGVGIGGGLAYKKLQSNKSEFAQQSNLPTPKEKERKGLRLNKMQKLQLGIGAVSIGIPASAYAYVHHDNKQARKVALAREAAMNKGYGNIHKKSKNLADTFKKVTTTLDDVTDVWS